MSRSELFERVAASDREPFAGGHDLIRGGLVAGIAGAAGVVIGLFVDREQVFFSWLEAYVFAVSVALGMAAFLMACHTIGATWPVAVRRLAEATTAIMPLMILFLVPVLAGLDQLYPWMHPDRIADARVRAVVVHKLPLMRPGFVVARAVFYVAVWMGICAGLRRFSLAMDRDGSRDLRPRLRAFSAALLPALGITGSWAAFDWVMSLSPDWYSTVYGLYLLSGGFLAALALLVVLIVGAQDAGRLEGIGRGHYYALGRLLLAFVVFWGYVAYFQFFLIWIADKPVEAKWYLDRVQSGTRWVTVSLVVGHFVIPFFALLSHAAKQRAMLLRVIAILLLAGHYIDVHWLVAPARRNGPVFHWLDAAALSCVVGFSIAFAVWRQRGHALAAARDPDYLRALEYSSR
jgi:hypothetical protein